MMAYRSHAILVITALLGIGAVYGELFQGHRLSDLVETILCYDIANTGSKNAYAYAYVHSNGISLCTAATTDSGSNSLTHMHLHIYTIVSRLSGLKACNCKQ